jgi:hypothetical protein
MWRLATACRLKAAGWLASFYLKEGFDGFAGFVTKLSIKILWRVVLDVGSLVVARLPYIGAVAVRDGIHNPLSQILGSRIEVKYLIYIGMVDLAVNQALNLGEIAHHAIAVKLFSTAIDVNLPIVAMQVLALALVVEIELMACGYF